MTDLTRSLVCGTAAAGLEAGARAWSLSGPREGSSLLGQVDLVVTPILFLAALVFLGRVPRSARGRWVLASMVILLGGAALWLACLPIRTSPASPFVITVNKARRELVLTRDGRSVLQCRIALGGRPQGVKECEGDLRTPEGSFYVCDKEVCDNTTVFHKWVGVSYPTSDDALRGLSQGRIVWAEYWLMRFQNLNWRRPLQNTWLGGNVGIHGGGAGHNWTLGCVGLENKDVDVMYNLVDVGTPIVILP
jgi:hypothetical protein